MKRQNLRHVAILIALTLSITTLALQAAPRRYYYDRDGRYGRDRDRRPNRSYRYVDKRVRHDHRVKVEVKRPHRDLYTALDVINTVANVVDAFTPNTPTVVQTNTVTPVAPVVPTYAEPQPVLQPQYVQPSYQEPIVQPQYAQPPVVENNTYVQQTVQTQPVYTQPQIVVPPSPVVVQPTPVAVPAPVYAQPQVQNNTTIVVPPAAKPYRRPYFPPRYYNRPIRRW